MFEDATFDARGAVRNGAPHWMMLTAAVNAAVVAGLIVLPLWFSQRLPAMLQPRALYAPPPEMVKAPEHAAQVRETQHVLTMLTMVHAEPVIARAPQMDAAPATDLSGTDLSLAGTGAAVPGSGAGVPGGMDAFRGSRTQSVVKAVAPAVARVSGGVVEGLLLPHATPSYPPIAKLAGVGGEVVLAATISAEGRIKDLRVISGHPLLRDAAIAAVQGWRYKPYLLNGTPVEVETTITVRYSLGRQ